VRDHTAPNAVIAAYDIGALKYSPAAGSSTCSVCSTREFIPAARTRRVELRARLRAEYLLYLQEPNTEHHTRIYLAEYGKRTARTAFRRRVPIRALLSATVTQSFGVAVYAVDGWHRADAEDCGGSSSPSRRSSKESSARTCGSGPLAAARSSARDDRAGVSTSCARSGRPTLGFHLTLYWRALGGEAHLPLAETLLSTRDERDAYSMLRVVAHGRVRGW